VREPGIMCTTEECLGSGVGSLNLMKVYDFTSGQ
jgi:hypothetical protein